MIRTRGNNLLKFSANDDDALAGLLGAGRHTDMGPEEAITDALTDIRLHELASMTAMQSRGACLGGAAGTGPDTRRQGQCGELALLGNRKARAWDAYEALHAEVLRGLSDDFDSVFGKRFALAYEQAMEELTRRKTRRRLAMTVRSVAAVGLLALSTITLAGCGKSDPPPPPPPPVLELTVSGSADQNPGADGTPQAGGGASVSARRHG